MMSDNDRRDRSEAKSATDEPAADRRPDEPKLDRRPFLLATASAISTATVAGCFGGSGGTSTDDDDDASGDTSTGTDGGANMDGDANDDTPTGTGGGTTSPGGSTTSGSDESCPLGGGTTRFDASGTPFVFHFEYDTGYQEPNVRNSARAIELPVEGAVGGAGNVTLLQSEPGESNGMDVSQGVITTTTYDGETVEIERISQEGIQIVLPYQGDSDGVQVTLTFGTGEVFPCTLSDLRQSAIRIAESMEPNPDNTV